MRHVLLRAVVPALVAACTITACTESPPQPAVSAAMQRAYPAVVITALPARDTIAFGEGIQLGAEALGADGRVLADAAVQWSSSDTMVASVSDAGIVVAGRREGTVRIRARAGAIEGQRAVTVRARAGRGRAATAVPDDHATAIDQPGGGTWTFCADIGSTCEYLGLRDVRLVFASGAAVQQTAYGRVTCSIDGFGDPAPGAGRALRCEYGALRRRALVNPMPEAFGMGSTTIVPAGATGTDADRLQSLTATTRTADGNGSFRTQCDPADFAFNDPLGNPDRPAASPLHLYFGNTAASTRARLTGVVQSGRSTCRGGATDRSVYYMPALIDARNGDVQIPTDGVIYFRTGYNMEPVAIQPIPFGLVIVAGDRNARGVQPRAVEWLCRDRFVTNSGMIPECAVGDQVQLWVHFPQCWDGRNLDSRDHRSHMAYAIVGAGTARSSCPPSHPVALPQLSQVAMFSVRAGASLASWRLSTDAYAAGMRGGLSAHAAWVNGWNPTVMRTIVSECLNRGADCNGSAPADVSTFE